MNDDLFQKVKELKLPKGEYALFGSSPLGIRGLRECHDVDIIVTPGLWEEYKKKGWQEKITFHGIPYLSNNDIELYKDWKPKPWDLDQLIREAEIIDDLPFVRIERVLEWKKLFAREKDLKDIDIIINFLNGIKKE